MVLKICNCIHGYVDLMKKWLFLRTTLKGVTWRISDTLQPVFSLGGERKRYQKRYHQKRYHQKRYQVVSCLSNKKKTPSCFSFSLFYLYLCKTKLQPTFLFLDNNKTLPETTRISDKWPWNNLDQQGLSDPMSLAEVKEYFKKDKSNLWMSNRCFTEQETKKK